MKRKWTELSARLYLERHNDNVEVRGKIIIIKAPGGFKGLTSCSALDYLVNHCGYMSILI